MIYRLTSFTSVVQDGVLITCQMNKNEDEETKI
jgi:hypothetical protein